MKIELPFELGQEVYWKLEGRKPKEIMKMQFIGYSGSLYEDDIEMTFKHLESGKEAKSFLHLEEVKKEIFATLEEAKNNRS